MDKYVDFYIKAWERIHISDKIADKIIEKFKSGEYTCSNDITESFDYDSTKWSWEILTDGQEQIELEDNKGQTTIIVYDYGDIIFDNELKFTPCPKITIPEEVLSSEMALRGMMQECIEEIAKWNENCTGSPEKHAQDMLSCIEVEKQQIERLKDELMNFKTQHD